MPVIKVKNLENKEVGDLELNDAVELPCDVSSGRVQPRKVGRAPAAVRDLLLRVKEYERLTARASVNGSSEAALAALTTNPLVGTKELAGEVLSAYVRAFGDQMHLQAAAS